MFGDEIVISTSYQPYALTNDGYTPGLFRDLELQTRFPLPRAVATIDQRMVLSIGLNGTGEIDIAHHYHPITAMRLLQGRKIWALRAPGDEECMDARGTCTDPFDVCEHYAKPGSPKPACVQLAGETIIVPDGWYHGTCNTETTVGWGAQGRSLRLLAPMCFHCNARDARGQVHYASTASETALLSTSDAMAFESALATEVHAAARKASSSAPYRSHWPRGELRDPFSLARLPPAAWQTAYMSFRSIFSQFAAQTARQAEENTAMREPDCRIAALDKGTPQLSAASLAWLRSARHTALVANIMGPAASVTFRHPASGETERRAVHPRGAAIWVGEQLVGIEKPRVSLSEDSRQEAQAEAPMGLILCRVAWIPAR